MLSEYEGRGGALTGTVLVVLVGMRVQSPKQAANAKLISLSDKLLTLQRRGFLRASAGPCFCLISRISSAWKSNSSVMESSLMKALSFAGFRWWEGRKKKKPLEIGL